MLKSIDSLVSRTEMNETNSLHIHQMNVVRAKENGQ